MKTKFSITGRIIFVETCDENDYNAHLYDYSIFIHIDGRKVVGIEGSTKPLNTIARRIIFMISSNFNTSLDSEDLDFIKQNLMSNRDGNEYNVSFTIEF